MAQSPINLNAVNPANALVPLQTDLTLNLLTAQGEKSHLNVTAAAAIKATPGRVARVVVLGVVGTGGALTLNDCATTGAAAAANEIFTAAGTIAVGTVIVLDWPCATGIVVSAVPTGGTPLFAISYT